MQQQSPVESVAVSINQTCRMLGLSRYSVARLLKGGQIRFLRVGRRVLIPADALRQFLLGVTP